MQSQKGQLPQDRHIHSWTREQEEGPPGVKLLRSAHAPCTFHHERPKEMPGSPNTGAPSSGKLWATSTEARGVGSGRGRKMREYA